MRPVYLFHGDQVTRLASETSVAEVAPIRSLGVPWNQVDAAVNWGDGAAYLFHGDEFCKFDVASDHVVDGGPQKIAESWPGLWERDIDAALLWDNHKAYFFKGDEHIRFDVDSRTADRGYPKKTTDEWPGVFPANLDAALDFCPADFGLWFFSDHQAVQFISDKKQRGPLPVAEAFPALPANFEVQAALDLRLRSRPHYRFDASLTTQREKPSDAMAMTRDGASLWHVSKEVEVVSRSLPDLAQQSSWSNELIGQAFGVGTITCLDAGSRWVVAGTANETLPLFDAGERKLNRLLSSPRVPARSRSATTRRWPPVEPSTATSAS